MIVFVNERRIIPFVIGEESVWWHGCGLSSETERCMCRSSIMRKTIWITEDLVSIDIVLLCDSHYYGSTKIAQSLFLSFFIDFLSFIPMHGTSVITCKRVLRRTEDVEDEKIIKVAEKDHEQKIDRTMRNKQLREWKYCN